ncbi:hypothetical protein H6F78_07745 [Coleofasciculus sp. FACHB-64]|uniref:hypothetical protein n=1 Tax=Cyanophyceae TaxID=3028117 RepID=UPI001682A650|nr:hypothetical protein [Coleofasciculus sp. FACHB-64]MBD2045490.1 hypothetical protein [Coleofasciculus sp. FACHB-64]
MNLWIVTIGSSDVQLDSDNKCREKNRTEKQRSNKIWHYWYDDEVQADCHDIAFEPKQSYKDKDEPYRIEARALGMVYEASSPDVQKEILSYLTYPLLDNFVEKLKLEESSPNAIAVLLTDQSKIFHSDAERRKPKCPSWQDTCTLKPILKQYFQDKFPNANCVWITLSPVSDEKGLDDWNSVLDLVRTNLRDQLESEQIEVNASDKVYVSHQAGTPAISSAVQFVSLAQFRTNVEFLVSNEYNQLTDKILSPTYLGAIQQQEAKALLARHDYSGVRDILGLTGTTPSNPEQKRLKSLLDAGEQWNFAEFQKFKKILVERKLLLVTNFPWYQSGFESIYLAWVRLEQGSTVDALFHSFRAAEGSIIKWVEKRYSSHIVKDPRYGLQIKLSVCQKLPNYFKALSEPNQTKFQKWGQIGLYGDPIYELLKQARPDWEDHPDIKIVWESAKKERNNCFHKIEGLQESEVFEAWETKTKDEWKQRILGCLNFIAKEDLPQEFRLLEDASLMFQVHEELENAIA